MTTLATLDRNTLTTRWCRDASDQLAMRNGCWFSWKRASYAVWWIERFCNLYEGAYAGQPMRLRGLHSVPVTWDVPRRWDADAEAVYYQRMLDYLDGHAAGEPCDWQYEFHMRQYGWVRYSPHWSRPIRRYRSGSAFVPKKSKKSPSLSANALYLSCGDGEPGNHVGLAAKDGNQVKENMATHIMKMIERSPELRASCKTYMNTYKVIHLPTSSTINPFSSSNSRTAKSKEGFNGSILVDEVHVVDWELIKRIDRAGISRMEPLHLEFSTAGDDPESYGYDRYEFCKEIIAGKIEDDSHLAVVYEADQPCDIRSMSDDEKLAAAIKANPALGHTVELDELLSDINKSCRNAGEAAKCMMYRLNIWQTSSSPWIPPHQWAACGHDLNIADYRGRYAIVGFDFGYKRDFAAFVAGVPEIGEGGLERLDLFPWIIAPRAYVEANQANTHFRDWEERGLLLVSPGDVIDLGYIYEVFGRIATIFEVGCLAFDPYRSEELTQLIEQGARSPDGDRFIEGYGCPRVPIGANSILLSTAIDEFHDRVIEKVIRHPRHEVLSSMIGNVNLKSVGGRQRIAKPSKDSVRKIDGAMAALLMFTAATNPQFWPKRSVYESRGIRTL